MKPEFNYVCENSNALADSQRLSQDKMGSPFLLLGVLILPPGQIPTQLDLSYTVPILSVISMSSCVMRKTAFCMF